MCIKKFIFSLFIILQLVTASYAQNGRAIPKKTDWDKTYPEIPAPENTENWGKHIQRTMSLLDTSTPQKRNTVRILFYGQSIVANEKWTDAVMTDLQHRFPHANIIYENRAIGGFSAQYLVGTSEADLYPFYPDLLIFHVYGSHKEYQEIIHNTRSRTTVELAIISDHLGAKEFDGKTFADPGDWKNFKRKVFVPAVAKEYDAQLIDITTPWKKYLMNHNLPSQALLKDGIHPNDHGCFLMSQLVARQLVYLPDYPKKQWQDLVKTYQVGSDVHWKDGKLSFPFTGNRVDLIAHNTETTATLEVLIDGKKPSENKRCYTYTRTSGCPGVNWPALLRVDFNTIPLLEDWTLTITKVDSPNVDLSFKVVGSKTGYDGEGTNREKFVSNSGRVIIEPWFWKNLQRDFEFKGKPAYQGFEITWSTKPLFVDEYQPPKIDDHTIEYTTTIAQNLENKEHLLQLSIDETSKPTIKAIRMYQPPVNQRMQVVANP